MRRVSYERERPSLRTRNALRRACGLKLRRRGAHSRGRVVFGLTSAGAALLPAVSFLNYGGPSSALCFVLGDATLLVAFLDVLGHPLLLVGVTRFISTGHGNLHLRLYFLLNRQIAPSFRRKAERACPTIRKPHATVLSALSAPRTTTISTPSGSVARKTAIVKVCGRRPHDGGASYTGAGVRKPPREETAGDVLSRASDAMGIWRPSSASTTLAIWHELCGWVKTPFGVPVVSKSYAL
jgi:hypothetical protein